MLTTTAARMGFGSTKMLEILYTRERAFTSMVGGSAQELVRHQVLTRWFLATINKALWFSGRIPPVQGGDAGSIPASAIKARFLCRT